MIKDHPILYSRTSSGAVQTWKMQLDDGAEPAYRSVSGLVDGAKTESGWKYPKPKNVGKANETTSLAQAEKEIAAKYVKKKKQANFEDIDCIDDYVFFEPMLAHKFKERDEKNKVKYPVFVQRKLDGTRCVRHTDGAFSRTGERYHCLEHIIEATQHIFDRYPHAKLDGELYRHGYPLSEITGLVSVNRKAKDITQDDLDKAREIIEYHVYDCVGIGFGEDAGYKERLSVLKGLFDEHYVPYVKLVTTKVAYDKPRVMELFEEYASDGYEGAIIRSQKGPYKNGRSNDLLKLKAFMDEEFEVLHFEEGTGNWAGCVKMVVCKIKAKGVWTTFKSNIKGNMPTLRKLWDDRHLYEDKGKRCTVRFLNYSVHEIPVIPYTGLPFREYE
jgi:DNA ligase 1